MEQLGLGVQLSLDDDMSRNINPIIRDLERLRNQARRTTTTMNEMRNAHNPFGRNRRQDLQDYHMSMQSADRVLLSVSDRLILATKSANSLGRALNRAQFGGNFNVMYRDMVRVQTMLGNMGYGMSKMQRDMSNLRAYNMMDVQIKDLHDRIKMTTKALSEMQKSPDSSKMVKEMDVAKRALLAYRTELTRVGSLQNKLTQTHGLGQMKSFAGAKDILFEQEKGFSKNIQNRVMGLANTDLALASAIMAKSLTATEKALVGTGYTALETKKKITQLTGAMTGLGMALTPILSLVSALALGGWGYLANNNEKMNAQFTGQSLTPIKESGQYQSGMREIFQTSSGSERDSLAKMFAQMKNSNVGLGDMKTLSGGANEINYAWGGALDSVQVLNSAMKIAQKTGGSYADSLDLIALGLKKTDGDLEGATEAVLKNAGAFKDADGQWRKAFDTLEEGNRDGSINRLIGAVKGLSNVLTVLWDKGMKQVVGGFADLASNVALATDKFLEAHPTIAKIAGSMLGLALVVGLIVGPIILVTGFMTKFRSTIQGVGLAIQALSARGGVAILGAQSTMLAHRVHGATVALARFPQTLLFGVIPALYSVLRMIPNFILNMARINPVMGGLTLGMIAYSRNWFGFGDTVKNVTQSIKDSMGIAKGAVGTAMMGGDVNVDGLSKFEQVLAQTMGTAKITKAVLKSIFKGEELKFSVGESNLIEQLGIGGAVDKIATVGRAVKDFTDGFVDGIGIVYDKVKTFLGWMVDTFEPVIVRVGNFISKLFGGKGDATSVEDIMNSANGAGDTMQNLGKMAGIALTALLGFKVLKPMFSGIFKSIIKNPFAGIISSAKLATGAVGTMGRAVGNVGGTVRRTLSPTPHTATPMGNTTVLRNRDGSASGTVLARHSTLPLTDRQVRANQLRETRQNARARGYEINRDNAIGRTNQAGVLSTSSRINRDGTYNGANANLRGQQVYARQQGRMSRALFGQAYDVHGADGRRTTINRQGGLLRRRSSDERVGERMSIRDRTSLAGQNARTRVSAMGQSAMGGVRSAGSAIANTAGGQRIASAGRAVGGAVGRVGRVASAPVRVPVQYVMGRLQTAGIIRQGQQGGRQSGGRFRQAFNLASRGLGGGARMFSGVVRGAGTAGRRAGSGMLRGMNGVSKGIGGIFKLGFKLIPFLGWALMAWDIISTVFTNWDKIKAGAQKAWTWIQTSGMDALGNAWEWIKEKASSVWSWIQENGKSTALAIASGVISFLGNAFTTIMGLAGTALSWILTDGIAKAIELGAKFIYWVATDAFPKIVSFAVGALTGLISTAGSIAMQIGSAMWSGITGALSGIGGWIGKQIAKVPGGSFVVEKLTGKDPTKYARGGIINSPHMGIVGEAGPEAIIPLSGNQRNRATMLLERTAGALGMSVSKVGARDAEMPLQDFYGANTSKGSQSDKIVRTGGADSVKLNHNVVRNSNSSKPVSSSESGSQDNSVTIQNLNVNVKDGKDVSEVGARKHAIAFAKELQKLMKQERMRGRGKNLTLEEMILNL